MGETDREKTVIVYDLGGGTFDITIAKITPDGIKVIATIGNHSLGGKDWDCTLRDYIASEFYNNTEINIENDYPEYMSELMVMSEGIKKQLTESDDATVKVMYGGKVQNITITLEQFNQATEGCLAQTTDLIQVVFGEISAMQG